MPRRPKQTDMAGLEAFSLLQNGYFHRRDAHAYGLSDALLSYHTRTGRFERTLPAVYRLSIAPLDVDDDYVLAWVWTGYAGAISHESALCLYELSDVSPSVMHLTVPNRVDQATGRSYYRVHSAALPLAEVQYFIGVSVTKPTRSIVDAAVAGTEPRQIIAAVWQALDRRLATTEELRAFAARVPDTAHGHYVQRLIDEALIDYAA